MRLIGVFGTECLSNERVACCVFRPCLGQQPCQDKEYGAPCEGDDDVLMSHGAAAGIQNKGIRRKQGLSMRSEEHTSELQSLMRISYAVFCLKKKKHNTTLTVDHTHNESD